MPNTLAGSMLPQLFRLPATKWRVRAMRKVSLMAMVTLLTMLDDSKRRVRAFVVLVEATKIAMSSLVSLILLINSAGERARVASR